MKLKILTEFLLGVAVNVSSEVIVSTIKSLFCSNDSVSIADLRNALKELSIQKSQIEDIIAFLAENGDIEIVGATIFARKITYKSLSDCSIYLGPNVESKTLNTSIKTGSSGKILMTGQSSLSQEN